MIGARCVVHDLLGSVQTVMFPREENGVHPLANAGRYFDI